MQICCLCEKRSAGRVVVGVPLCLACRTASYERVAAAEEKPTTIYVSLTSSADSADILLHDHLLRVARGQPGRPLGAA
jgi:hypothetical protein